MDDVAMMDTATDDTAEVAGAPRRRWIRLVWAVLVAGSVLFAGWFWFTTPRLGPAFGFGLHAEHGHWTADGYLADTTYVLREEIGAQFLVMTTVSNEGRAPFTVEAVRAPSDLDCGWRFVDVRVNLPMAGSGNVEDSRPLAEAGPVQPGGYLNVMALAEFVSDDGHPCSGATSHTDLVAIDVSVPGRGTRTYLQELGYRIAWSYADEVLENPDLDRVDPFAPTGDWPDWG